MSDDCTEIEDSDFEDISGASFRKLETKLAKLGYADGAAKGRESAYQTSFDIGYADGFRTGFQLSKFKAFCNSYPFHKTPNDRLLEEKRIYDSMGVPEAKTSAHCQYLKHQEKELNLISVMQTEHVNNHMKEFASKLPITFNELKQQFKK